MGEYTSTQHIISVYFIFQNLFLCAEHDVSSNILVSTVDLVVTHFAHRCMGSTTAEEQCAPGTSRSPWSYGVASSTEVRDLRGIPVAQGMDALSARHALLPVLPRGHGSQAETPSDLHVAELSATPEEEQLFRRRRWGCSGAVPSPPLPSAHGSSESGHGRSSAKCDNQRAAAWRSRACRERHESAACRRRRHSCDLGDRGATSVSTTPVAHAGGSGVIVSVMSSTHCPWMTEHGELRLPCAVLSVVVHSAAIKVEIWV